MQCHTERKKFAIMLAVRTKDRNIVALSLAIAGVVGSQA